MDHEIVRLKCLEMARAEGLTGDAMVERAEYLFAVSRYGKVEADRMRDDAKRDAAEVARIKSEPAFDDYSERK